MSVPRIRDCRAGTAGCGSDSRGPHHGLTGQPAAVASFPRHSAFLIVALTNIRCTAGSRAVSGAGEERSGREDLRSTSSLSSRTIMTCRHLLRDSRVTTGDRARRQLYAGIDTIWWLVLSQRRAPARLPDVVDQDTGPAGILGSPGRDVSTVPIMSGVSL